ncbi:MAG TPA: MBL fold metallo-hydrolase [Candidatus Binatia bacterium]|jgi:ribonuclease BN (tRNA processing enzyme)
MKLHILGCGDAFGSGGRNTSGYLIESGERLFLLDCGPTTLLAMKRAGFNPERLDAVFLSHLHGDHCAGLPFFFTDYLHEHPRRRPLRIAGPEGTEERVRGLFQWMFGERMEARELPPSEFFVLKPGEEQVIDGIRLLPFRVPHQVRDVSLGLKVAHAGKTLLYSGDSPWTEEFIVHARGADLFLCECCFFERATSVHMNYRGLEENLERLECKEILLTHMGEEMLARRGDVKLPMAEDGMVIEL